MLKAKQKTVSILLACLTMLAALVFGLVSFFHTPTTTASAAEATETLNIYANKGSVSGDTITWTGEHFTFTNVKGGTNLRTSDSDHYRAYNGSTGAITSINGEMIKKVVITCTASSYTDECQTAFKSTSTATISGSTVTIVPSSENSTSITYNSTASAQWRLNKIVVTYEEAAACEHEESEDWTFDSATNEHYKTCAKCNEEMDGTRVTCSEFTYGDDYTTENGVHTRTATCTVCGGAQTESGTCEINAAYTRNGNTHTQTGTCSICGDTTSLTEDCTLTYTNTPNGDKTHTMTSSCSVCEIDSAPEIVDCTFESEADGLTVTHTCKYCGYSYDEEVAGYTVTYVVPNGVSAVDAVEVAQGYTTELPTADAIEGYTFVGWTTDAYAANTAKPEIVYEEGYEYTPTEDVTLYALYSYAEGTGDYTMVTDVNTLAVGKQIVIVASGSAYALGSNQASNNRTAVAVTKESNNTTVSWTTAVQVITLETGKSEGTWALNVGDGYLYAASSSKNYLRTETTLSANSSWSITISSDGVATIKAQGSNTRNWLRKNSNDALFSCYESGQNDVSIYMKDGNTYYTTSFAGCEHSNTTEEITDATCEATGLTKTVCSDCGAVISEVEIPALGHNYVDNFCSLCGEQDPETIDYSGYYYFSFTHNETVYYVDNSEQNSGRYYARTEAPASDSITIKYVYRLVKVSQGIYSIYDFNGNCYAENAIVEKVGDVYRFYDESRENQFLLNAGTTKYVKFYKATNAGQSNYAQDITLTPVELNVNIDSASVTVGDSLTVNYKVSMPAAYADAVMHFTLDGKTEEVSGTLVGTQYVFSLPVPPQAMADNIVAELYFGETIIASKATYSIQEYAQNRLNDSDDSTEKRLVSDMLYYGAAAQIYKDHNTGNLATADVANLLAATDEAPAEISKSTNVYNTEITEYPAYIASAGVYFDGVNQLYIKLNTIENVKVYVTIDSVKTEANLTGTTYYTDGISATGFATEYVFEVYHNDTLMQTLTYSVDAYVYAKKGHAEIGELALALYRYGKSAEAYKNA